MVFTVVSTIVGLVATPYLLRWLGSEAFGAFRALSEWMGYLALLELGLAGATMTIIAKAAAEGPAEAATATRVAMRAFSRVAMLMLVGGMVLSAAAPALVPVSDQYRTDLRWAAIILTGGTLLVVCNPLRLLLETAQRGYIVNLLLVGNSIVLTTLSLLFAYHGGGVKGQAAAAILASVIFVFLVATYVWRNWLRQYRQPINVHAYNTQLWKNNWQTVALDVSGRVSTLSDNIVIGYFLGPAMVAPFMLTQRLIQVGLSQVLGVGNASWAALASLYHLGEHELMRKRLLELSRLTIVIGGMVLIPATAYNRAFIRLWIGDSFYGGDRLTMLAGVVSILAGLLSLWGWVFRGAGIIAPVVPTSIASATVNVAVSIFATAWLGWLEGPLVGTAAGFVGVSMWRYPLMFRRHFQLDVSRMLRALTPVLAAFFACGAAAWWVARTWPPDRWDTLIAAMAGTALAFAALAWLVLLNRDERALWRQRVMMMLRRNDTA